MSVVSLKAVLSHCGPAAAKGAFMEFLADAAKLNNCYSWWCSPSSSSLQAQICHIVRSDFKVKGLSLDPVGTSELLRVQQDTQETDKSCQSATSWLPQKVWWRHAPSSPKASNPRVYVEQGCKLKIRNFLLVKRQLSPGTCTLATLCILFCIAAFQLLIWTQEQ